MKLIVLQFGRQKSRGAGEAQGQWRKFFVPVVYFWAIICVVSLPKAFPLPLNPHSKEIKPIILQGIRNTINNQFDAALNIFAGLIKRYPQEPIGYFYYAAALQSLLLDGEDYTLIPKFEKYIQLCLEKAQQARRIRPNDPWLYFYEGNAYLYRAFLEGKQRHWWGAYRDSRRGASRLKRALEIDSTLYEAYLGLGSFQYWKSSKAKFLSFLPLFKDERKQGIEMVRLSVQKGALVRWIARDQLAWILIDAGNLPEAQRLAEQNVKDFPHSRFFKWTLAEVYYRSANYEAAYRIYSQLLAQIRLNPKNNHLNELTCLYRLAKSQYALGQFKKACQLVEEALQIQVAPILRKFARPRLKKILKLRLDCEKNIK